MNKPGRPAKVTEEIVMEAVRKLRIAGRPVTIPAVREHIGSEGGNGTVSDLIKVCEEKLRVEDASLRKLSTSQEALAQRLMRQAVSEIVGECERDSNQKIEEARLHANEEVDKASRSASEAWHEVDERVRERDEARAEVIQLRSEQLSAMAREARAEGLAAAHAEEIKRLAELLKQSESAKEKAQTIAAEARGQIELLREQLAIAKQVKHCPDPKARNAS